jgi:hypothetical protein
MPELREAQIFEVAKGWISLIGALFVVHCGEFLFAAVADCARHGARP